ncbi:APC family permease [Sulfobacillus thermosulfidooxidans]|uniref:APC family permease n=1 Tax=Sulfobacillus thermosulfidooxidans TaxID=28034 RepID=UPI0006B404F5|nr:amino acid permease [Sulfobacillus thermosulfidooxidans]
MARTSQETPRFIRALGLFSATAVNMSQMVGIGPFITIPLILSAMGGPQAILGWIVGALLAMADGLVWSELGAAMPGTGGSYVYLREAYQYYSGKLVPFLFVWSTLLATPLIMSTGMIGMANYLGYFWHGMTPLDTKWVAAGITIVTVALLYRRIDSIARITQVLWGGMLLTVLMVIVAAATHFHPRLAFSYPPGAFALTPKFFAGLGAGLLIAIYDYLGYYTTAYLGDEVKNPGKVIPGSILLAILAVGVIDLSMNIGIIGVVPWHEAAKSNTIGTLFMEKAWGPTGATILALLILWTAFASVYTGLLGGSRLPYNAARDKLFFKSFGVLHPRLKFPYISLLVMGGFTAIFSFFSLSAIINALMAISIVVQFIGQVIALTLLRIKQPELHRPFRQWLYPLPSLVAFIGWIYVFVSSGWPAIRLALIWTVLGLIAFVVWAYYERVWPFHPLKDEVKEMYVTSSSAGAED